jgi:hypothetical protein
MRDLKQSTKRTAIRGAERCRSVIDGRSVTCVLDDQFAETSQEGVTVG